MHLIIFGPPGAGKGTQASFISQYFSIPHISTGDIFRANIMNDTPLGIEAKRYLDAGELVPDSVTNGIIRDALSQERCSNGFLLDGFPRTLVQAESLDGILLGLAKKLDRVINLVVERREIIDRMLKRRRGDDTQETIAHRITVYERSTQPLIEYYRGLGILTDVEGMGGIPEITQRIISALKNGT